LIIVWDAANFRELWRVKDAGARSLAWSPDGSRLAAAGGGPKIRILDPVFGKLITTFGLEGRAAMSVAWSPDGRLLAAGGDGLQILDALSGKNRLTLRGHKDTLRSVTWAPSGASLASAGEDGMVKIWHAGSGNEIQTLLGHSAPVYSVAWSPDGERLATGSSDRTVVLWHAKSGMQVCSLGRHRAQVSAVAWSPDGTRIACADIDGNILIHKSGPSATPLPPPTARNLPRPPSPDISPARQGAPQSQAVPKTRRLDRESGAPGNRPVTAGGARTFLSATAGKSQRGTDWLPIYREARCGGQECPRSARRH